MNTQPTHSFSRRHRMAWRVLATSSFFAALIASTIGLHRDQAHAQSDQTTSTGSRLGKLRQVSSGPKQPTPRFSIGTLPRYTPPMHKAPGKELIDAYCTTCHSTSYITAQPPFPEAIWRSEVNKMIHTYGAIIPKETAEKIIAYLAKHYSPQSIAHTYAQIAAAKHTKTTPPKAPSSKAPPAWMAQAQTLYAQKCTACHQANGAGLPGAFPPLAGHAQRFTATPALRSYMIRAVLYGLQGHIKVDGKDYFSMMPPLPPTSDQELALILNYVTHAWGNQARQTAPAPQFSAQDIKAQRGLSLTPLQVHGARKALGL